MESFNLCVKSNVDETKNVAMMLFAGEGEVSQETLTSISSMSRDQAISYCEDHGWKLIESVSVADGSNEHQSGANENDDKVKMPASKKKKIFIIAGIVAVLAVAIIGLVMSKKAAVDYDKNLELATLAMLSGAGDAETAGTLIHDVWYNCIYEKRSSITDKYTQKKLGTGKYSSGIFYSDFNDALGNLFSDQAFKEGLSKIKTNQDAVAQLMKKLQNPSSKNQEAYDAIKELYAQYTALTNLVLNPTGSLQSFTADFNAADSGVLNAYHAMELYLDK